MIKRIFLSCLICFSLISCAELQSIAENYPQQGFGLSQQQIANGLKQALDKGIDDQVSKLTQTNGFYKNQLVKIEPVPLSAHHQDLIAEHPEDSKQLVSARKLILDTLRGWWWKGV